ncbi:hypothetical protein GJ744_008641 [Endocarpon pusillum]|uniref:Uncharacterized protein n=1 Tax=Endocarpon pusillum TaxID=364733 RepID=A0A8H7E340_9EURO|nr:hypothetical protein GJ744_008641 [Endocarpon pusillum]
MDIHIWPNNIRNLKWPNEGVTYSYEHRGYMAPEKIEHWLLKAFGDGNGKYVLFNERIYIKAPRKPTSAELRWMQDGNKRSGVEVAEYGWLTL